MNNGWFLISNIDTKFLIIALILNLSCKKSVQKNGLQTSQGYTENEILNSEVSKILEVDTIFFHKIKHLTKENNQLFFLYSKQECNTCINNALLELYTLSKVNPLFKNAIVITPEPEEKEIKNLKIRYDNKITFINHEDILLDKDYFTKESSLAIFFVFNANSKVENAHVYKRRKNKLNESYFNYLKNLY